MDIDLDDVKKAYLYLKSYAYHENLNLFLKQRIAEFESEGQANHFTDIVNVIKDASFKSNDIFIKWLKKVNYHVLPKNIDIKGELEQNEHNKKNGLFISNVRDADTYQISKVNYFINAPVQLHIIDMLWCVFAAPAIEILLEDNSYGNRMHPSAVRYAVAKKTSGGHEIFKRYIDQYNLWRDQAVNIATGLSKEEHDVALLSLDLKSYFYYVDVDFDKIKDAINKYYSQSDTLRDLSFRLTEIIEDLYRLYNKLTKILQKKTHPDCINKKKLPIGLASSSIIANWYLSDFDKSIADEVRPAYYGRYVDDILMVFKRPKLDIDRPIESFVDNYLSGVLLRDPSDGNYAISVNDNLLPVQKDKLILQFFDKSHSRAGLEVFKQELDERSSAFKFLPSEHIEKELDKFAYDVLYDGSANKLRSIVGLAENETELAKYLTSHITAHRLCKLDKNSSVLPQLKQFFKGQNALRFHRLWEKIYQYSLVTKNYSFATSFHHYVIREVSKVEGAHSDKNIKFRALSRKIIIDLKFYNELSLAITVGLLDLKNPISEDECFLIDNAFLTNRAKLSDLIYFGSDLHEYSWQFRYSNLIRHHLVAWPLLNYSNFNGDLSSENGFMNGAGFSLEEEKIKFSPRFIHYDEWALFKLNGYLSDGKNLNDWFCDSIEEYSNHFFEQDFSVEIKKNKCTTNGILKSEIHIGNKQPCKNIKLAVANIVVNEEDIYSAIRKDTKPNLSFPRQEKLFNILNSALIEKADMLVMPEVAIPVSWLPFMVSFSRRHQIGLVFGLEHWVVGNRAYNVIIEALPFKISDKYKSCAVTARLKNHYAPAEKDMLGDLRLTPGISSDNLYYYHSVSWRGVTFATYNCFELSDITHRVLFKSEIDLLFACVWNKDTNYYQHILESAVRDLHCYTVQANTSQYGGSCILRPTKTENKTMLYVKGGENSCVLTASIDISALRSFQFKSKPNVKDTFKHLPPGYDSEAVLKR